MNRHALHLTAITTPTGTPAAVMTRALASRDRWAAAVADLKAQGVTGLRCPDCGFTHSVSRAGMGCNAHTDAGTCDSTARLLEVTA